MTRISSQSHHSLSLINIVIAFNTFFPIASSWSPHFDPNAFQSCIKSHSNHQPPPSSAFYSPHKNLTAFTSVLTSTAENLRFVSPYSVSKPLLIFTPLAEIHVKAAVICAQLKHVDFRVRSGGHDYEGLSYVSYTNKPYVVIDMSRLRYIHVDASSHTAWAQAGATLGELYYRISQKSKTLAFPAGLCTTIGLGGHLSGGAYGTLMRKHGLGDDNVLDARIVTASGEIQVRRSMGKDLFWAIRGGTGGSFGIVLAWKLRLVKVPETVTVFTVPVYLEPSGTEVMSRWLEIFPEIDEELFIRVIAQGSNGTVLTVYQGLYLGDQERLLSVMDDSFPELGLTEKYCAEMSWIESVMVIAGFPKEYKPEYLLQVKPAFLTSFKGKSDYLTEPIPTEGLEGMWGRIKEDEKGVVIFTPFGGRVSEIKEGDIPFCHRNVLGMVQYVAQWGEDQTEKQEHQDWVRALFNYMTPYVTINPRQAYGNYRDFDIGMDDSGLNRSCPRVWGQKYFKDNFVRLVNVKSKVDPYNVFNHELSIPTWMTLDNCTHLY